MAWGSAPNDGRPSHGQVWDTVWWGGTLLAWVFRPLALATDLSVSFHVGKDLAGCPMMARRSPLELLTYAVVFQGPKQVLKAQICAVEFSALHTNRNPTDTQRYITNFPRN